MSLDPTLKEDALFQTIEKNLQIIKTASIKESGEPPTSAARSSHSGLGKQYRHRSWPTVIQAPSEKASRNFCGSDTLPLGSSW